MNFVLRTFIFATVATLMSTQALAEAGMSIKLIKKPGTSRMKLEEPQRATVLPVKAPVEAESIDEEIVTNTDPRFEIASGMTMLQAIDTDISNEAPVEVANDTSMVSDFSEEANLKIYEMSQDINLLNTSMIQKVDSFRDYAKTNFHNNNSFVDVSYRSVLF